MAKKILFQREADRFHPMQRLKRWQETVGIVMARAAARGRIRRRAEAKKHAEGK